MLWHFFDYNRIPIAAIMIVLGCFLTFTGGRFHKLTMFLAGQLTVTALILIIMFIAVIPGHTKMWVVWLVLVVALGIGSGIGFLSAKHPRVGVLLVGSWIGGLIGSILYNAFIHMAAESNPLLALWLTIAATSIITSVLAMVFFDYAIIIGASIAGAYTFVRVSDFF